MVLMQVNLLNYNHEARRKQTNNADYTGRSWEDVLAKITIAVIYFYDRRHDGIMAKGILL